MEEVVNFILEIDKLKAVLRKVRPVSLERFENAAEHSWQIALLAASLVPFAETTIDTGRVINMLLVHDLGEIDAGDLFVFAREGWEDRKAAELAGVNRLFGLLPEQTGAYFFAWWKEFEAGVSPESRFAHMADRAMPVLLNLANEGGSWRENGIGYEQVVQRVGPEISAGCPALWDYLAARLKKSQDEGWFGGN